MSCRRYLPSCRVPSLLHPSWSCIHHHWRWSLSLYLQADRWDQIFFQLWYMFNVPQFQFWAIREANHHFTLPDNVIWFIISQIHLFKFTFYIVLKHVVSESSVERCARINHPWFIKTSQGENQSVRSITLCDIREILLFAFAFSIFLLHAVPLNMPLLTTPPTVTTHRLWVSLFLIWIWICHSFSFLCSLVFLFDQHSGHSLMSSPTPKTSCTPLHWEVYLSDHQTSRFLSHRNCSSSRDHPRPLVDWTIEPVP